MASTLDTLTKSVDELSKKFDELDSPDLTRIKTDPSGRRRGDWSEDDDAGEISFSRGAAYDPRVKSHKRTVRNRLKSIGYTPNTTFKSFGEFIQEGMKRGTNAMESRVGDSLKSALGIKTGDIAKTIQGMNETIGTDGGILVVPEFSSQIFDRVYTNDIFSRTDNYTVSGNSMTFHANKETSRANGARHGGLRGYWVGEGNEIGASKPGYRELTLKLKKLAVVVYLTEELIQDAPACQQYVTEKVAQEFDFMLGDVIFRGTGAGQPLGIFNSPALLSVAKEQGQPADTVLFENVNNMWARMFGPSRGNATWYMNQDVEPQLDAMSLAIGTGGAPVYLPQGGVSVSPFRTLKGRPIQDTEFNPTLGDRGDLMLADLSQYITISKGGIAQAVSMHVEFLTDQTALRFTMRVDGQTWENSPITPYQGTNTQSNFIVLDERGE